MMKTFSEAVTESIGYYVYVLVDPRNNEIFYVGKGKGNRVFNHISCVDLLNAKSEKLDRIHEILDAKKEVLHYIIRHGLTEEEAYLVESVLINFLTFKDFSHIASITNIQSGHQQWDKGIMTTDDLNIAYNCPLIECKHTLLCININATYKKGEDIYEATRKSWRLNKKKADEMDYVISEYRGIVRAIYKVNKKGWQLLSQHAPTGKSENRYFFEGEEVKDKDIRQLYLNKRLPKKRKGQANPIWYLIPF